MARAFNFRKLLLFLTIMLVSGLTAACGAKTEVTSGEGVAPATESQLDQPQATQMAAAQPPAPLVENNAVSTTKPTIAPPPSPTPPATATAVPPNVIATQTAAAAPPTPLVTTEPTPTEEPTAIPVEPLPTRFGTSSWTLNVPILMYHYVSTPPEDADVYRTDLSVTPEQFREQIAYLADNGFTTVDLYDLSLAIVSQIELPEKPIILTFDDGYLDNYEVAYPILQEYGMEGTFFVVTEFIDSGRAGYMTWPMIEEMALNGMRIESHSRTHPDLRGKSRDTLIWELLGSRETLAAHIGSTPRYFCYPGGHYDENTIQILEELGYWGATTTQNGTWHGFDERFEWRRVRIRNTTSIDIFAALIEPQGTVSGKPVP